jgi:hypothetical protein
MATGETAAVEVAVVVVMAGVEASQEVVTASREAAAVQVYRTVASHRRS